MPLTSSQLYERMTEKMPQNRFQFEYSKRGRDSLLSFGFIQDFPKSLFYTRDVFFELDRTLFKFPMYYLIDSGVFERILIRQILGRGEVEHVAVGGDGTLESPFTCTTIDKKALKSFLTLRKTAIYDQTPTFFAKEEWVDILKVAYFWQMENMREFAVSQLSKMQLGGIEKLKLAKQFGIRDKEWRLSAVRELIKKTNLILTDGDVAEIGVNTAMRIYRLQGMASQRLWLFPVTDLDIKKEFPELS